MRLVTIAAAIALIGAGCGSVDANKTTQPLSSSTTAAGVLKPSVQPTQPTVAALTDSFTGVTAESITIAVVSVDYQQLRDSFGVQLDYQDSEPVMQPLIDELNRSGGINGRRIDAVYRKFLPVGGSDSDRVCVEVTEDIGVFAVFGGFVGPGAQEVNLCLTRLHNTMLIGLVGTAQQVEASTAPWIAHGMSQLRRSVALVTLLAEQEILAPKVAIWASNAELFPLVPEVRRALEAAGTEVVFSAKQSASASDLMASDDEYRLVLERALAEGAEAVYWLGNGLSPPKIHASDAPEIPIYDPFAAEIVAALRDIPDVEKITVYSTGIFPSRFHEDPLLDSCINIVEAATDIVVTRPEERKSGEPDWYEGVSTNCEQLEIFRLAATAAGPDLTNESFLAAAENLGSIDLPAEVAASLGHGKYDVSDATGLGKFDASANGKGDFVPVGPIEVFG